MKEWSDDPSYQDFRRAAWAVTVVNDSALRGLLMLQQYKSSLTKNEEQKHVYNTNDKQIRSALKLHDEHG